MVNYLSNKNFIPRKYIETQCLKKNRGSKRGVVVLVIINLLALPLSLDELSKNKEVEKKEIPRNVDVGMQVESVIRWIDYIDEDVISINIINNIGTMTVKSMQKIYKLEEEIGVQIDSIKSDEVKNYNNNSDEIYTNNFENYILQLKRVN